MPSTALHPRRHILVVGASAAGLSTAEALRRRGFAGRLTIIGDELWAPDDRPPLSKQVLAGGWEPSHIALRPAQTLAALDADLLLGTRAVHLDAAERTVTTADGRCLRADAIVIATGAAPRTIPSHEPLTGVHMLRTMDDALGLSAALRDHRRLVVVGDGVLGMEAAATARLRGVSVTVIGAQAAPMSAQLGPLVADFVADLHHQQGVEVLSGVNVGGLNHRDGRVTAMAIEDGPVLDTDLVLVAIGARPTTDWLNGSGLILDDGVVCNAACAAADGILPSATSPAGTTKASAATCGWRTAPTPLSRPSPSRRTCSAGSAPTPRSPTSGPTNTTPRSPSTACPHQPIRSPSSREGSPSGASSPNTARATLRPP